MRKRLALCVGINDYPSPANQLSGCVNDATDWQTALLKQGYDVQTLLDYEASKANIVDGLMEHLGQLNFGDRFVFTFSGHGTWVPDQDGDEADKRDEALCCYDFSRGGLLIDDEMFKIFQNRKFGSRVTVISDSCHSGTVSRFMADPESETATAKFISPTTFLDISHQEAERRERSSVVSKPRSGTVLFSGCADPEFSYDATFHGRSNGAMTYFLVRALGDSSSSVKDVYGRLRKMLPSAEYPQTPQLVASTYQKHTSLL